MGSAAATSLALDQNAGLDDAKEDLAGEQFVAGRPIKPKSATMA